MKATSVQINTHIYPARMWAARITFSRCNLIGATTHMAKRYSSAGNDLTTVTFTGGVKTITMCDTKTRNALSLKMMENLIQNITHENNNIDLRVIVLAAKGNVFSAGHNLKELDSGRQVQENVFRTASKLMSSIIDSPVPVIAKVDGIAAAAGCQLVAQCDMVFCTERSKFSTPGVNFGIFCSTPGVALARCIPKNIALKMLLTGEPITSTEAKMHGLVSEVFGDNIDEEVDKVCQVIKAKSRSIIELGKRFYYKQINLDVKKAYEVGGEKMVDNLQFPDGQEGLKGFKEKRKPVWSHKN